MPGPTEIIELSDSEEEDQVVTDLRRQLANIKKEKKALRDANVRLNRELQETKKKLAELGSSRMEATTYNSSDTQTEIVRVLNQDLEQMTSMAQENYNKYMDARRASAGQKTVVESLWKTLECPICFEPVYEPVVFRCGHLICETCAPASPICGHCRTQTGHQFIKVYALKEIVRSIAPLVGPDERSPQKVRR